MKKLAILIAAVAMIGFMSSESFAQRGGGGHGGGGHGGGGYRGGGGHTSWGVSLGNGYGSGFTFGQGPRGNSFYGLNLNSGGYGGYGGYAPAYRPVYRPVPRYYGGYGGGYYGGGGCRGW